MSPSIGCHQERRLENWIGGVCTWRGLMGNGESEWRCSVLGAFRPVLFFFFSCSHFEFLSSLLSSRLQLLTWWKLQHPHPVPYFAFSPHICFFSHSRYNPVGEKAGQWTVARPTVTVTLTTSSCQVSMLEPPTRFHTQTEWGQQGCISLKVLLGHFGHP